MDPVLTEMMRLVGVAAPVREAVLGPGGDAVSGVIRSPKPDPCVDFTISTGSGSVNVCNEPSTSTPINMALVVVVPARTYVDLDTTLSNDSKA